ncbi:hypothetical protein LTR74_007668 [Friedmanniomyces endolithicus]|nr:hypothetical protein LTR74_007668 [Friedmanniomyces endolithicus]
MSSPRLNQNSIATCIHLPGLASQDHHYEMADQNTASVRTTIEVEQMQPHTADTARPDVAPSAPFRPRGLSRRMIAIGRRRPHRDPGQAAYAADMLRRERRLARRWEQMTSRTATCITVSPIFSFPVGRAGRILLSKGTNHFGWMTEAMRLMSEATMVKEHAQVLLGCFLTDAKLMGSLDERRRRLHPDAEFTVPNRRRSIADWTQAWDGRLEDFRDGFDGFMGMGNLTGYCWMVDEEVAVDLRIADVEGRFVIVAQGGVEAVVPLGERYAADVEPIVIDGGMPLEDDD